MNTMTPGQKLDRIAAGKWNPYYLAYALDTGANDPEEAFTRDGSNAEYFVWNSQRWDETCKHKGINRDYCSAYYWEHLETLAALPNVSAALEKCNEGSA